MSPSGISQDDVIARVSDLDLESVSASPEGNRMTDESAKSGDDTL